MSNKLNPKTDPGQPLVYQIRLQGHLGRQWSDWFGGLTITLEDNGETLLTGPIVDQAALYGLLRKVRDLGLPLLSVIRVKPGPSTKLGTGPSTKLGTGPSTKLGTGPSTKLGTGQAETPDDKG